MFFPQKFIILLVINEMGGLKMVNRAIKKLVQYGLSTGLITEVDRIYATNQLLDVLGLDEY